MADRIAQSVGVDIAKDCDQGGPALGVVAEPAPLAGRVEMTWLTGFPLTRVAFEPSGAYHRAFERRLAAAGLPLVKVNPRQARRFAEAIGRQAKLVLGPARGRTRGTDAVDAAMLARFAALLEPPVRPVVSATRDAMKELQGARRALRRLAQAASRSPNSSSTAS